MILSSLISFSTGPPFESLKTVFLCQDQHLMGLTNKYTERINSSKHVPNT